MNEKPTLTDIIGEFDAGIFIDKATEALKMVALGCMATGKDGSITVTIKLKQIGESGYVNVSHKLAYAKPTKNGKATEENETSTPMFVDNLGYLSAYPTDQDDLFNKDKPSINPVTTFRGKQ